MRFLIVALCLLSLNLESNVMSQEQDVIKEWQTYAEKTGYRETPRYAESIEYSKRLDEASTLVQFASFGKSGEGGELPLLIVAEGGTFDPAKARRAGKAIG